MQPFADVTSNGQGRLVFQFAQNHAGAHVRNTGQHEQHLIEKNVKGLAIALCMLGIDFAGAFFAA